MYQFALNDIEAVGILAANSLDRPFNINPLLERAAATVGVKKLFLITFGGDSDRPRLTGTAGFTIGEFRDADTGLNQPFWSDMAAMPDIQAEISADIIDLTSLRLPDARSLFIRKVIIGRQVIGLLGSVIDHSSQTTSDFQSAIGIFAALIAQNLRVEHAVLGERERLREENQQLKQELKEKYDFSHLVGTSNEMRQVYEQVSQVARSNATVLLRGESGTGKEMIANAIHYNSLRSKRAFIKINCAALPDTLIESELFGHERGAFTGADRLKRGRFELADGGTLFLDEIGDLPLQTQIKLLRVLQEREFERLGGTETISANIRLVTATNKNLEDAIAKGEFRGDLYYRLNVFSIFLPSLRQRRSDILLLAEHFLEKYEAEHGKRIRRISTPAIDMLMSYHYPGNVRELENAIERAVLVCDTNVIHSHHLPPTLQTAETSGTESRMTLASAVAAFERDLIVDTLKSTSGNIAKAARQLESTERILGYKIKKHGIDPARFRQ
ncbi:MAG: sigma 54-interacting transcriptional regulator [bacterium]|nr:sigma 54-interacting transcriptional regulator [bacterium]